METQEISNLWIDCNKSQTAFAYLVDNRDHLGATCGYRVDHNLSWISNRTFLTNTLEEAKAVLDAIELLAYFSAPRVLGQD